MSTKTIEVTTCDVCGKEHKSAADNNGYVRGPFDPWLRVSISGGWVTPFGDAAKTQVHACSPKCAADMLEKLAARTRRLAERFPETSKL